MWKRNDPAESASLSSTPESASGGAPSMPAASLPTAAIGGTATIGPSVVIKGELAASEDLTTEGRIEGKIKLQQHVVTIGQNATVRGQVFAREVIILGHVVGDINATDKVVIERTATSRATSCRRPSRSRTVPTSAATSTCSAGRSIRVGQRTGGWQEPQPPPRSRSPARQSGVRDLRHSQSRSTRVGRR